MRKYKESSLPKWARFCLDELKRQIEIKDQEISRLQQCHAILADGKKWFILNGPSFNDNEEYRKLWILNPDHPFPICTLARGDVLLVGRKTP